ncbi:MAG: prephenate dehydrogenase [Lachnospiraceae bacterium]|nr:prephenate dehydrogenase [Lachnospiraceae bacterium]
MAEHIGFIGLGLIGGSIAKALKKEPEKYITCAYNRYHPSDNPSLNMAHEDKVIDYIYGSLEDFGECDIIFLCAPVLLNASYLSKLKSIIKPSCIITDVGSVKTNIHEEVDRLGLQNNFIGGHPMAGSDRTGYEHASEILLENAYYLLTPTEKTPPEAVDRMKFIINKIKAIPFVLDNTSHDEITAAISHLPHIIAASLVNMVHDNDDENEHMKTFAAGGFKDITRIASSSPQMWQNICLTNTDSIIKFLDIYRKSLNEIADALASKNSDYLYKIFENARDYRDSIPAGKAGTIPKFHEIYVDVPDVPGIIAIIATILSSNSVNIRNIGIVHNREFENGVLRIEFYSESDAQAARTALSRYPYPVYDK